MTEETGNDPPRRNLRPKRATITGNIDYKNTKLISKDSNNVSAGTKSLKQGTPWSEEEELSLLQSFRNHKWNDWKAIKVHLNTERTEASIEYKSRVLVNASLDVNNSGSLKNELLALLKKRREEFVEMKKGGTTAANNPVSVNLEDKVDKTAENESQFIATEMPSEAHETMDDKTEDVIDTKIPEIIQAEEIGTAVIPLIETEVNEPVSIEPVVHESEMNTEVTEDSPPIIEDTTHNIEPVIESKIEESSIKEKIAEVAPVIETFIAEDKVLDEIVEVKQEDSVPLETTETVVTGNTTDIQDSIDAGAKDSITTETQDTQDTITAEAQDSVIAEDQTITPVTKKNVRKPKAPTKPAKTPAKAPASKTPAKAPASKTPAKTPAKTSAKTPAKTPSKTAKSPTKAKASTPYTRKTKNIVDPTSIVNTGEEVSILSSSSESFTKESINIMSSSSSASGGRDSISSIPSVASIEKVDGPISSVDGVDSMNSSAESVPSSVNSVSSGTSSKRSYKKKSLSETSSVKSSKSDKSSKSTNSGKSKLSSRSTSKASVKSEASVKSTISDDIVAEWEKKACPSIFGKSVLKDPESRYKRLRNRIKNILKKNPGISDEEVKKTAYHEFSESAIEQVLEILREGALDRAPLTEDFELMKKMSMTSSGRKRKIRSEEGDWIDPNEIEGRVISHEPATPVKEKRKRKYVRKDLFTEDGVLNSAEDPFTLILLNDYSEHVQHNDHDHVHEYDTSNLKAPFKVEMCSSVIMLMDLHSHLHSSEIIGLLGGTFTTQTSEGNANQNVLRIEFGYPCGTAHSTGTQVDVDPLSEMEAGDYFEQKGVKTAGWYHSHPNFEPNPSLRDLETQTIYQGLFRNNQPESENNVAPFVGVIVNPYLAVTESSSHVECFYVAPPIGLSHDRLPFRLPIVPFPFDPESFPELLAKMRQIVEKAAESPDRLDMQKNAEPGVKRIDKLLKSLKFHGNLTDEQMEQIKELLI